MGWLYKSGHSDNQQYLIIPECAFPPAGSWIKRSCIISSRCFWADTTPLYLVTKGQSMDATTYTIEQLNTIKSSPSNASTNQIRQKKRAYCSNGRTTVLSRLGMRNICTKYYSRYIGYMRYSISKCIIQYRIRSSHLYKVNKDTFTI